MTSSATRLWRLSRHLHAKGRLRTAKAVKAVNFHLNHGLLPSQAVVGRDLRLEHHGLGVVIHPNVTIGDRVQIWHNVTIAAETRPGSPHRVLIGDDVVIGAGALIVARTDQGLVIGSGSRIGAGCVVTRDVPAGAVVIGPTARVRDETPPSSTTTRPAGQ